MKKTTLISYKRISSGLILATAVSLACPLAFSAPNSCTKLWASAQNRKATNLEQFTSSISQTYRQSSDLAIGMRGTSMAPFFKNMNPFVAARYQTALTEFLAPTLLTFSVTLQTNSGNTVNVTPLQSVVTIPAVVKTWGEAQAEADYLAKQRGLPALRAEQNRLSAKLNEYIRKQNYEGINQVMAEQSVPLQKVVKILRETHVEAYGQLSDMRSPRNLYERDKVGITSVESSVVATRTNHFHIAYNKLIELQKVYPELFDKVLKEMTVNPEKYFAAVLVKYLDATGSYAGAIHTIKKSFLSSGSEADILKAFADLTAATLVQRKQFGSLITARNSSDTYNLGSFLTQQIALKAGADESILKGMGYVDAQLNFASPLGEAMFPY